MVSIGDRLRRARESCQLSMEAVAQGCGTSAVSVWRWESGVYAPNTLAVMGLSLLYRVPVEYFLSSEEEFSERWPDEVPRIHLGPVPVSGWVIHLADILRRASILEGLSLDRMFGLVEDDGSPVVPPAGLGGGSGAWEPLIASAESAGGAGVESGDEPVGVPARWLVDRGFSPRRSEVVRVLGDSMGPGIPDGCSVLVDLASRDLQDGQVYVLRVAEGLVVKRVRLEPTGWRLDSDNAEWNPGADPVVLVPGDVVVGRVRSVITDV